MTGQGCVVEPYDSDAFQIQPRQKRLQRTRLSHIRRDQSRAKPHRRFGIRAHLGNLHCHRTSARLNLALRPITASNYRLNTGFGMLAIILRQKLVYFGVNRQCDQLFGSVSNQIGERISEKFSSIE